MLLLLLKQGEMAAKRHARPSPPLPIPSGHDDQWAGLPAWGFLLVTIAPKLRLRLRMHAAPQMHRFRPASIQTDGRITALLMPPYERAA